MDVLFPLSETYTINERRLEYKVIHQETDIFIFFSMHLVNCVLVNKIDSMPPINSGNHATILLDMTPQGSKLHQDIYLQIQKGKLEQN